MRKIKKTTLIATYLFCINISNASESIQSHIEKSIFVQGLAKSLIGKAINEGVWNNNKTALAISIKTEEGYLCLVALKNNNKIKIINTSQVEQGNFGKLGYSKSYYNNYKTYPTQWLRRSDGMYQVEFVTQAWKGKKRFTVKEPLVIKSNGIPIYR